MSQVNIASFCGVDFWDRVVFRRKISDQGYRYYCIVDELAEYKQQKDGTVEIANLTDLIERVNNGQLFVYVNSPANDFDGEPDYAVKNLRLVAQEQ